MFLCKCREVNVGHVMHAGPARRGWVNVYWCVEWSVHIVGMGGGTGNRQRATGQYPHSRHIGTWVGGGGSENLCGFDHLSLQR